MHPPLPRTLVRLRPALSILLSPPFASSALIILPTVTLALSVTTGWCVAILPPTCPRVLQCLPFSPSPLSSFFSFQLRHAPSLTSLSLSGCKRLGAAGVLSLASRLKRLRVLNLTRCRDVDDLALGPLAPTTPEPRTPTAVGPLRAASMAYSTWNKCPSGEKTVMARS